MEPLESICSLLILPGVFYIERHTGILFQGVCEEVDYCNEMRTRWLIHLSKSF